MRCNHCFHFFPFFFFFLFSSFFLFPPFFSFLFFPPFPFSFFPFLFPSSLPFPCPAFFPAWFFLELLSCWICALKTTDFNGSCARISCYSTFLFYISEASHACKHSKALTSRGRSMRSSGTPSSSHRGCPLRAQQRCRRAGLDRGGAMRHRLRCLRSPERRGGEGWRATGPSRLRAGCAVGREDGPGRTRG